MDTVMIEDTMGGMLDHDLIKGPHDCMIDETGDPDRVIDHGHCSSMVEYSRLSLTMLEYDPFLQLFNSYYLAIIVMDDM